MGYWQQGEGEEDGESLECFAKQQKQYVLKCLDYYRCFMKNLYSILFQTVYAGPRLLPVVKWIKCVFHISQTYI